MPSDLINYALPAIGKQERAEMKEVLNSTNLSRGPKCREFEAGLCELCEVNYAVAVSSGSAALHLACLAAGVSAGDRVVLPAVCFASAASAVVHCGGRPELMDINAGNYAMAPDKLEQCLAASAKPPKMIMPVSIGGYQYDRQLLYEIAEHYQVPVIADMSHALGSYDRDGNGKERPVTDCRYEKATIVSFQALKNITTAEGGAVLTNDADFAETVRTLRNHGMEPAGIPDEPWRYDISEPGYNYHLSDVQCALGIGQLRRFSELQHCREEIAQLYNREFENMKGIISPPASGNCNNSRHLYIIRVAQRKLLYEKLREAGYKTQVHYVPLHYFSFMKKYGLVDHEYPMAENYYQTALSIPLFPDLTRRQAIEIAAVVKGHIQNHPLEYA